MKICEGCIKQDVCKFKKEVEKYEVKRKEPQIPEPLEPDLSCKYRKESHPNWDYTYWDYPYKVLCSNGTTCIPNVTIGNSYPRDTTSAPWDTTTFDVSNVIVGVS